MRNLILLLAAALAVFQGCACDSVPDDAVTRCEATQVVPGAVATDILFVVDDSGSMEENQANLAANLGVFVQALKDAPVQNDFRVGVTTSSVTRFVASESVYRQYTSPSPSAGTPFPAGAIVAVTPGTPGELVYDATQYAATGGWGGERFLSVSDPDLLAKFDANVRVGADGSGKEQPFLAARLALSDRLADANAGFLRPGARLAVIFVTDEDDCSETDADAPDVGSNDACHDDDVKASEPPVLDPPEDLALFLLGPIGGERRDVTVGVIAGLDPTTLVPSCANGALCPESTACGSAADGGDRFTALADALVAGGGRARLGSVCDTSFADTLQGFAEVLVPTALPLEGAPADPRMLVVSLVSSTATTPCTLAAEDASGADTADVVYAPPRAGAPALLRFRPGGACELGVGDRVDLKVICAD